MSTTTIQCVNCLKMFERIKSHVNTNAKHGRKNICSPQCKREWMRLTRSGENNHNYNKVEIKCYACGKSILRNPCEINNRERLSCSLECKKKIISDRYQGKNHPCWKGGIQNAKIGYIYKYDSTKKGHYQGEHTAIAERVLGRPFVRGEVVHHINLNKKDNRNRNLIICTQSFHRVIHHLMAKRYAELFLGGSPCQL